MSIAFARIVTYTPAAVLLAAGCVLACGPQDARPLMKTDNSTAADWRQSEREVLANHVQLTFGDRFSRAGEAYFSPDDAKIIFQAIEQPEPGMEIDEFYAMYVADLTRNERGRITGITNITRISPKGTANTCGWFHPTDPNVALFASTVVPPKAQDAPGYQRDSGRYKWMFPPEMKIVQCDLRKADGTAQTLEVLQGNNDAYVAECSLARNANVLLYCSLETGGGDIYVKNLDTGSITELVGADGYDGGPFFSPDTRRICYRSDRRGDNLLQIFIAELSFDDDGAIIGVNREFQITDNDHVNWAPFWHPDGRHLIYTTSEVTPDHSNYEVFAIDADPGDLPGSDGPTRYGTKKKRITNAAGFDGLPVFNADGSKMMWTSQRSDDRTSQLWVADFVADLDASSRTTVTEQEVSPQITIEDPESGRIFIYNTKSHTLSEYNPTSHKLTPVTDEATKQRVLELMRK